MKMKRTIRLDVKLQISYILNNRDCFTDLKRTVFSHQIYKSLYWPHQKAIIVYCSFFFRVKEIWFLIAVGVSLNNAYLSAWSYSRHSKIWKSHALLHTGIEFVARKSYQNTLFLYPRFKSFACKQYSHLRQKVKIRVINFVGK